MYRCRVYFHLFDVHNTGSLSRTDFETGMQQIVVAAESTLYLDLVSVAPTLGDLVQAAKGSTNPSEQLVRSVCLNRIRFARFSVSTDLLLTCWPIVAVVVATAAAAAVSTVPVTVCFVKSCLSPFLIAC
jgi:hypothetical protein